LQSRGGGRRGRLLGRGEGKDPKKETRKIISTDGYGRGKSTQGQTERMNVEGVQAG